MRTTKSERGGKVSYTNLKWIRKRITSGHSFLAKDLVSLVVCAMSIFKVFTWLVHMWENEAQTMTFGWSFKAIFTYSTQSPRQTFSPIHCQAIISLRFKWLSWGLFLFCFFIFFSIRSYAQSPPQFQMKFIVSEFSFLFLLFSLSAYFCMWIAHKTNPQKKKKQNQHEKFELLWIVFSFQSRKCFFLLRFLL